MKYYEKMLAMGCFPLQFTAMPYGFIPPVYFTNHKRRAIVASENREISRKGRESMISVRFAMMYFEHLEQRVSGYVDCPDSMYLCAYKAKKNDCMIS